MKTIYKYEIKPEITFIDMHSNAKILTVQNQNKVPQLWVLLDTEDPLETRVFHTFGTGHVIPDDINLVYIATWQLDWMVFHTFEEIK